MKFSDIPPALQGAGFMLASMACFSLMSNCVRLASQDLATPQVVLLRNVIVLLLLLPWLMARGWRLLRTEKAGQHFRRALAGTLSMHCWFFSLHAMPIADATALSFTAPVFVSVIAILILREKSSPARWGAIAAGFAGTLVILRPGVEAVQPVALLALTASALIAIISLWIKQLSRTETPEAMLFYMALYMALFSLPGAYFSWRPPAQGALASCAALAASSLLAHLLLIFAYKRAEMTALMPLDFVRLLFTSAIAWWWFGETPDGWTAAGAGLIIAGSMLAAREGNREVRRDIARAQRTDAKE